MLCLIMYCKNYGNNRIIIFKLYLFITIMYWKVSFMYEVIIIFILGRIISGYWIFILFFKYFFFFEYLRVWYFYWIVFLGIILADTWKLMSLSTRNLFDDSIHYLAYKYPFMQLTILYFITFIENLIISVTMR